MRALLVAALVRAEAAEPTRPHNLSSVHSNHGHDALLPRRACPARAGRSDRPRARRCVGSVSVRVVWYC